jgi:hypothetical protein
MCVPVRFEKHPVEHFEITCLTAPRYGRSPLVMRRTFVKHPARALPHHHHNERYKGKDVEHLLRPYPAEEMDCYRVSPLVNNVRNDSPECLKLA